MFDELAANAPGDSLILKAASSTVTGRSVAAEVAELNAVFVLPHPVTIKVQDCGEANAFYHPSLADVTVCSEFEDWIRDRAPD